MELFARFSSNHGGGDHCEKVTHKQNNMIQFSKYLSQFAVEKTLSKLPDIFFIRMEDFN